MLTNAGLCLQAGGRSAVKYQLLVRNPMEGVQLPPSRIGKRVVKPHISPRPQGGAHDRLVAGFAAIAEMAPRNATEAMLATQMIAVHDAALSFSTGPRKTIITMPPIEMLFGQVV